MNKESQDEEAWRIYQITCEKMQSGVAVEFEHQFAGAPAWLIRALKHLRVGINSAMVETSAIQSLLVQKGICTEGEHMATITVMMEQEVATYEKRLSELFGKPVTLGSRTEEGF